MNWQEIISLLIVFLTLGLVIRKMLVKRTPAHQCGSCALAEAQKRITNTERRTQ